MNKKQAIKSVLFVIIFLFVLKSVTYMLRTNGNIKEIFVGFYAEPKNTIDVVMIGSSPVYPYYVAPKLWGEYGIAAYPLSSNVQRPKAAKYIVQEVAKTQEPELFIFEMRMYIYEEGSMEDNMPFTRGITDNLKYSLNRVRLINALVPDISERYTYYFDIFKYHSNWKTIILPDQYTSLFYERLHPLKGYAMNDKVIPGEAEDYSTITSKKPIPPEQEEVLYQLLDYIKENNLNALFIVSPTILDEEMQMQFNYIGNIVTSYGYNYLNMNNCYEEIGLDFATDFYDGGGHTNTLGAQKCTAFLGQYLEQNYNITDRRGDEKYTAWDDAYAYWLKCQEDALKVISDKIARGEYDELETEEIEE